MCDRNAGPLNAQIVQFLTDIGLTVRPGKVPNDAFLPGIAIMHGELLFDEVRMLYPGDLLHEAGHLAVLSPRQRKCIHLNVGSDPGEEMAAIAWSYAAALHLAIDPAVVFHEYGYKGGSTSLLENFAQGRYVGVPILQWRGLALEPKRARDLGLDPYPAMLRWVCSDECS